MRWPGSATATLVDEIRKLGLRAEPAAVASPGAGTTLSIEGQVLSINEGNKTRRLIIGFGAGASEVRTLTQVYEVTGGAHRLVDDFYTTAKSSRKPGVGPMGGAGAAAGRAATSAAVSGGVGLASERSQTAEADAQHAAREIAKELAKFFVEQRWITQDQADQTLLGSLARAETPLAKEGFCHRFCTDPIKSLNIQWTCLRDPPVNAMSKLLTFSEQQNKDST